MYTISRRKARSGAQTRESEEGKMDKKMELKMMWNGIKIEGKLKKAHYGKGAIHDPSEITIYSDDYNPLPEIDGLVTLNDSDAMTDYFETDRIRVPSTHPIYPDVLAAYTAQEVHRAKRSIKFYERRKARGCKYAERYLAEARERLDTLTAHARTQSKPKRERRI